MKADLGLYVHIPFCASKCKYCDFLSFPGDDNCKDEYIERLKHEIKSRGEEYSDKTVSTIYIGGGTPSILNYGVVANLCDTIRGSYDISEEAEITIEINPGTVDLCKLEEYYNNGINRLSIGMQSTNDSELNLLGRIHTYEQFLQTYSAARQTGFTNINVDIISGLPGQTIEDYTKSLERILRLHPEHISSYSLQLEEGTYLYDHQDEYSFVDEELDRELYMLTGQMLQAAGYNRYEISNYSLPGYASKHNSRYWTRGDYLGLGLGASSMVENTRFKVTSDITRYGNAEYEEVHKLSVKEQMEEFMFLGLRLMSGVSILEFRKLFGVDIDNIYGACLERLEKDGLIVRDTHIRLTEYGIDVSNYVFEKFLIDSD